MRLISFLPIFDSFDFRNGNGFNPDMDIFETDKDFVIEAKIPGVSKNDMKLNAEDDILTLEVEKKKKKEDESFIFKESREGKFKKIFSLPNDVESDKIKAKFENGVLRIIIPKAKVLIPREITLN